MPTWSTKRSGPNTQAPAPVEFCKVTKRYGDTLAVSDIDLTIYPGEFLTLLGPSGSGKSTLLMLLAGFEAVSSGEIRVGGNNLANVPANRRNQGVVFQSYALFPHLSVYENLEFPLDARGVDNASKRSMIEGALERVRMQDFSKRYPAQLSGGQQQRVALARAIVFDPPLILMDESLSALDRKLRHEMQFELKELHRDLGKTMVYVTHDQDEAMILSDRIVVMDRGRIAQTGTPAEVYDRPATAFVAGFMGEANLIDGVVVDRLGQAPGVRVLNDAVLSAVNAGAIPTGTAVSVMVRPEAIELLAPAACGPAGTNRLPGDVVQVAFIGDSHHYRIRVDTQTLKVKVPRAPRNAVFSAGDPVCLYLHSDGVRLVPR